MRTMYDSVNAGSIPTTAQMVAGYVDGAYKWTTANWARFPKSVKVRIAVFAHTNDGHVLDVEDGNATPAQAPVWVLMRRAKGIDPTVYCSMANWPAVRTAFQKAKVIEPHYWIAAYPGNSAQLYTGTVAHQYASTNKFDTSAVADYWPGVDQKPVPKPVPVPIPVPVPTTVPVPAPVPVDDGSGRGRTRDEEGTP